MSADITMEQLNWGNFNQEILKITREEDCLKLLEEERKGQNRTQMMLRLYGRYSKLRRARELKELVGKTKGANR